MSAEAMINLAFTCIMYLDWEMGDCQKRCR